MTVRMSNAFFRSGFLSRLKISPTVAKSVPKGCG